MQKIRVLLTSAILFVLGVITVSAQMTFIHPGGKETIDELNFVKAKIQAGAQPWTSKWNEVRTSWAIAGAGTIPSDENGQRDQSKRAYANALAYWYTGTATYADQAIAILKAFGNVAPYSIGNDQSKLDGAWMGAILGPAAELLRGYMSTADRTIISDMFKAKFYNSLQAPSGWNGNVEATQIEAMFSIAVFCEDKALFDYAVSRFGIRLPATVYLKSDGPTAIELTGAAWYSPNFASPNSDGLGQESCRDWGHHTQYAVSAFISAAEVAFHQGTDLYKTHQTRLVAAMELLAKQMTTGDMQGVCTNSNVTSKDVYNTFEIGYNHYHNVIGLPMTETEKVLPKIQGGTSDWDIFYETLTHNGVGGAAVTLCETPKLGADKEFCTSSTQVLDAGIVNDTSATFIWNTGETTKSITVSKTGTYTVTVGTTGCETVSDAVIVTSKLLNVTADTLCAPGVTNLVASGGSAYTWYDVATGGTSLSTTATYSPSISATKTYYVQDPGGASASIGKAVVGAGTIWNANTDADFSDVGKINKLIVLKALTLNSISVYVTTAGSVTLNLKQNGTAVYTKTVTVTGTGKQTIALDFTVAAGEYVLDAVGTKATISFEATGAAPAFPYTFTDYLTFTYNVAWSQGNGWYGYFYDIKFTAGNVCARTSVEAIVDNNLEKCHVITAIEQVSSSTEYSIYPNPATSNFTIKNVIGTTHNSTTELMITNTLGQIMYYDANWPMNSEQTITTNNYDAGLYFVKIGNQIHKIVVKK